MLRAASALQQCGTLAAARWHVTAQPPCLHLLRAGSSWPAAASTTINSKSNSSSSSSSSSKRALHLFVCATDAAADQAGAALVSALKQLHSGALQLTGVVRWAAAMRMACSIVVVAQPRIKANLLLLPCDRVGRCCKRRACRTW
jgi:hypothetical protein